MQGRRSLCPKLQPAIDSARRSIKRKEPEQNESDFESIPSNYSDFDYSDSEFEMDNNPPAPVMGDFARPVVEASPSCIVLPAVSKEL